MNAAKVTDNDYIQFLIAAQRVYTCTEAEKVSPQGAAHDAYTRLLSRRPIDHEALWLEAEPMIEKDNGGVLILDDSTLDKPYAKHMDLAHRQWSGKHRQVVQGINITSLVWSNGTSIIPTDCRIYDKPVDNLNKNEHARAMLRIAHKRGIQPQMVMFDSWYSSLENLKLLRNLGMPWLCRLKSNRNVNPEGKGKVALSTLEIPKEGCCVHLKGYGYVKVFKVVDGGGKVSFWSTSNTELMLTEFVVYAQQAWDIETYHRGIKQCTGIEKCQARKGQSQRNHILFSLRAFLRLEYQRVQQGRSWYDAKHDIVREAIFSYLAKPFYTLPSTA